MRAPGDNWRTNNYNELNIIENGFLDEFKLAMANLQANNAAGGTRAGSFAYFGAGTGTSPLPIMLAYFNGVNRARAGDARAVHVDEVPQQHLCHHAARGSIRIRTRRRRRSAATAPCAERANALRAGLPANFFLVNPDLLGGANIVENTENTMYNSMALEFKRRSANGLQYAGSYVFGHATEIALLVEAN